MTAELLGSGFPRNVLGIDILLIHEMVGVTTDALAEAATVFFVIYWMLVAKSLTGNAWGTVLLFMLF